MTFTDTPPLLVLNSVKLLPNDIKLKARTLQLMYETTSFYAPASKLQHAFYKTSYVQHTLTSDSNSDRGTQEKQ